METNLLNSTLLCFGLGHQPREQVVMKGLHLGITGVVLPVLDAKDGVVRESAVLGDLRQIANSALQLGDDLGERV